jgi:predicted nucleic acid-binding protein
MIASDVNGLLYALREESDRHVEFRAWLENVLNGSQPVALFEPVLAWCSGSPRILASTGRPSRDQWSKRSSMPVSPHPRLLRPGLRLGSGTCSVSCVRKQTAAATSFRTRILPR